MIPQIPECNRGMEEREREGIDAEGIAAISHG
jgi:hypothetical protein